MISRKMCRLGIAALAFMAAVPELAAQGLPPPPAPGVNPACQRLEGQLAALDRGARDPARQDQIRRYEDAANQQQAELDRVAAQARRAGCEGSGFFSLFGGQPAQCGQLNARISQMRGNLDRILSDLQRLQSGAGDRDGQRRALMMALAQNNCGPQYRSAMRMSQPGSLFDALFGPGSIRAPYVTDQSSTFRTVCVRTCDGYYFPISYSTDTSQFAEDEKACQRLCPAAEVMLFTHRNPGEDMTQAVSINGQPYTELPNAFLYRKQFNAACSCKPPGQTWADALKHVGDQTVQRGDIIVTDDKSKPPVADPRAKAKAPPPAENPKASAAGEKAQPAPGKRDIRTVGPVFYPVR